MTNKYPSIKSLSDLIKALKPNISDDSIDLNENSEYYSTLPYLSITIGFSVDGSWDYQTGDNCYSGGAYRHPHWAVASIYRRSNSRELAKELINQLQELTNHAN